MRTEKEIIEDYQELLDIVLRCNGSGKNRPGLCAECKVLITGLLERAKRERTPKPKPNSPSSRMTVNEEKAWIRGEQAVYRSILSKCLRHLPASERTKDNWRLERLDTIAALRSLCALIGDNDWPDDLNLADVVQKHIHVDR